MMRLADVNDQMRNSRKQATVCLAGMLLASVACLIIVSCSGRPRIDGDNMDVTSYYIWLNEAKSEEQLAEILVYLRDSLDVSALYESTLWNACLTVWVSSYPTVDSAVKASEGLIERVARQTPATLKPLIRELCLIFNNRGKRQAAQRVAAFPYGIDVKQNKEIAKRLLTSTLLPGTKAPAITGLATDREEGVTTILLFYESACRTCGGMIRELSQRYVDIQKTGIRVVTISADSNEKIFAEYGKHLPWPDNFCDYQGFQSATMERFGVASVPTLFLIDRDGVVVDQYLTLNELWGALPVEQSSCRSLPAQPDTRQSTHRKQ